MSVPGPTLGPCTSWIDGDDVAAAGCAIPDGSDAAAFDDVAVEASMLAFELSGRQFTGLCERTVRPCRQSCGCFVPSRSSGYRWSDGYWFDESCSSRCGCGSESYVRLAGYPVRGILEVKIDGVVLDSSEYRLDGYRDLLRMSAVDGSNGTARARSWPACQSLALDDDQPGTFAITYRHGVDPPQLGRDAAAALACELWRARPGTAGECKLPSKATKVVRQGVTVERVMTVAQMLREGSSGIPLLDAFLAGYNPTKMLRRPAIFSPDLQRPARDVGV